MQDPAHRNTNSLEKFLLHIPDFGLNRLKVLVARGSVLPLGSTFVIAFKLEIEAPSWAVSGFSC